MATETVTILFTDLVGSTALALQVGPTPAETLRREHFTLLRGALDDCSGREVKNLGDGLMAAFQSAAGAVDCAVLMQQRLQQRNRRAEQELSVRVGISLGEADRDEDDYFGPPVVEAARLCASAVGGQILCAELARMMASGRTGHVFEPVGPLELKGLPEPVTAFRVSWQPLAAASVIPLHPRLREVPQVGYVGRSAERQLLGRLFQETLHGARRIVLISGEPGIGKTRLATYAALAAHGESGATVLYGHCDEDLGVPYQPWVEILRHFVQTAPAELLEDHVARYGGELASIVPELRRRVRDAPLRQSDPETERYLLYAAIAGLIADYSGDQPLVLILDDLHWADPPTLDLLKYLTTSGAEVAALIIATYRETDIGRGHPLVELLADLRKESAVERIALTGLSETDLATMIEAVAGHELTEEGFELAREVARETDGNPFFAAEVLRHLVETGGVVQSEQGRWTLVGALGDLGLPQSVREVVGRRIARLGDDASRLLSTAAVIGREFQLDVLASVTEHDEGVLLDLLDEAVRASLLIESSETPGRFTFAHALINHTLYEELGSTRRARSHRKIGETLEDLYGADPGDRVGELAHHWAAATEPVAPRKAAEYARRAGDRALAERAPGEALRWFEQAAEILDQLPRADQGARCDLLISLGDARRQSGEPSYRENLLEASRLALEQGDDDRLVRAVLANNRGRPSIYGEVDEERVTLLETALARHGGRDLARRARLLSILAMELNMNPDYERRRALSDEALTLARRAGDDHALAQVLRDRWFAITAPGTLGERQANVEEMRMAAERLEDPVIRFWALLNDFLVSTEAGEIERAREALASSTALAEEVAQPTLLWSNLQEQGCLAVTCGSFSDAEAIAERGLAIGSQNGEHDAVLVYGAQVCFIWAHQARWDEVLPIYEQSIEVYPRVPAFRAAYAMSLADAGRTDDARSAFEAVIAQGLPQDQATTTGLACLSEVAWRLRDRAAAAELYTLWGPVTERVVCNGAVSAGACESWIGTLAATLGRHDEAVSRFAHGIELEDRIGARTFTIRTSMSCAETLLERGHPGDAERAAELLGRARRDADLQGCPALAQRAEEGLSALAAN